MADILLIDDDEMIRALYCEVLEMCGHRVTTAADGEEGVALFKETVQLVITDMNMPRKSGLQTVAALRERCPSLPIIGMSGEAGQCRELPDYASVKGVNRFLFKPFTPDEFCEAVGQLLPDSLPLAVVTAG